MARSRDGERCVIVIVARDFLTGGRVRMSEAHPHTKLNATLSGNILHAPTKRDVPQFLFFFFSVFFFYFYFFWFFFCYFFNFFNFFFYYFFIIFLLWNPCSTYYCYSIIPAQFGFNGIQCQPRNNYTLLLSIDTEQCH